MAAKAVVVFDSSGSPIENAEVSLSNKYSFALTNGDGYTIHLENIPESTLYVRVLATGFSPAVYPVVLDGNNQEIHLGGPNNGPPNTIHLPPLSHSFKWPSIDVLRAFRGNFSGLVLPYLKYGPDFPGGKLLFTPSYVVESDQNRTWIRRDYKAAGYKHFPLNLTNHSTIYHDDYPDWDDKLIDKYLIELLSDGLIPVGFAMGDNDTTVNTHASPGLVPIVVPKWESPNVIVRPALDDDNYFWLCKKNFGKSLIYWHNPTGVGAPYVDAVLWGRPPGSEVNGLVWNYMVNESFVQGLLYQVNLWVPGYYPRIQDLIDRLVDGGYFWPVCDLVEFESVAYYLFNGGNYQIASNLVRRAWEILEPKGVIGFGNGN